jgi:hypothetical protein
LPTRLSFFRWLEDYSDVTDEQRSESLFAALKRVPLASGPTYPYLSVGGNYRIRYEHYSNQLFGLISEDHADVLLNRFMVHSDVRFHKAARLFVQFGLFDESFRPGPTRSVDESELDYLQAFLDLALGPVQLRLGRQELVMGSIRLFDIREGPNQRLAFDAARATVRLGQTAIDVFYAQEVIPKDRAFKDSSEDGAEFWGVYASKILPLGNHTSLDLYYLGIDRDDSVFDQGVEDQKRHTIGFWFRGDRGPLSFDYEGGFQFGEFGSKDIRAFGVITAHYYTFPNLPWKPRIGLLANVASGDDDPNDGVLQTYDAPFPNPSFVSDSSVYAPRNFYELHPIIEVSPHQTVSVRVGLNFLWRFSKDDAVYVTPGVPLVPGQASDSRFTGGLVDLVLMWFPSPFVQFKMTYNHLGAGDSIKDLNGSSTEFFMISSDVRF